RLNGFSPAVAVFGAVEFGEPPGSRRAFVERLAQACDFGRKSALLRLQIVTLPNRGGVELSGPRPAAGRHEPPESLVNRSHNLSHATATGNGFDFPLHRFEQARADL